MATKQVNTKTGHLELNSHSNGASSSLPINNKGTTKQGFMAEKYGNEEWAKKCEAPSSRGERPDPRMTKSVAGGQDGAARREEMRGAGAGVHTYKTERDMKPDSPGGKAATKTKGSKSKASPSPKAQSRPSSSDSEKGKSSKSKGMLGVFKSKGTKTSEAKSTTATTASPKNVKITTPATVTSGAYGGAREKTRAKQAGEPDADQCANDRAIAATLQAEEDKYVPRDYANGDGFENYNLKPKKSKKRKSPSSALAERNNMNQLVDNDNDDPKYLRDEAKKGVPSGTAPVPGVDISKKIVEAEKDLKRPKDRSISDNFNEQPRKSRNSKYEDINNTTLDIDDSMYTASRMLTDSQAHEISKWEKERPNVISDKIRAAERDPNLVGTQAAARANQRETKTNEIQARPPGDSLLPHRSLIERSYSREDPSSTGTGNPLTPWLEQLHHDVPFGQDMQVSVVRDMLAQKINQQLDLQSRRYSGGMSQPHFRQILQTLVTISDNQLMRLVNDVARRNDMTEDDDIYEELDDVVSNEDIRNQFSEMNGNLRMTYEGDFLPRRGRSAHAAAATSNQNSMQNSHTRAIDDRYQIGGTQQIISEVLEDDEFMQDVIANLQESEGYEIPRAHHGGPTRSQDQARGRRRPGGILLIFGRGHGHHHHCDHHHHSHHDRGHHYRPQPRPEPIHGDRSQPQRQHRAAQDRHANSVSHGTRPSRSYDPGLGALFRLAPAFTPGEWREVERDPPGYLGTMFRRGPPGRWMETRHFTGENYEELWNLAYRLGSVRSRGMNDQQLKKLKKEKYKGHKGKGEEDIECSICITSFSSGEEVIKLKCAHVFHNDCIVSWLKRNATCPICRANIGE